MAKSIEKQVLTLWDNLLQLEIYAPWSADYALRAVFTNRSAAGIVHKDAGLLYQDWSTLIQEGIKHKIWEQNVEVSIEDFPIKPLTREAWSSIEFETMLKELGDG